tara:strand:- start:631 stop:1263 length:633 start_codon:yes stop_codon:yes gene_type:complete
MNIEQKELINIIREELAEALGMDQEYERSQLAAKVRDLLDEYTGEDLEAAMDTLNAVRAMLSAEMKEYDDLSEAVRSIPRKRGLSPNRAINMGVSCAARYLEDAGYDVDIRALAEAVTSAISLREDLIDDPTKAEEAEAKQRAAQGEKTGSSDDEDNPGEYVPTSEGSRSRRYDPRNYVGRDVGRRFTHGSDGKKPPTGLYGKRKYFEIK